MQTVQLKTGHLRGAMIEALFVATDPQRVPCFDGQFTPADQRERDGHAAIIEGASEVLAIFAD